jgi:hypothetical protein
MRSLWENFTVLEDTLFELQKVGNELAASRGNWRRRPAHSFCFG